MKLYLSDNKKYLKTIDCIGNMCVVDEVADGVEIASSVDETFYPFDINITVYGDKIKTYMATGAQSNKQAWESVFLSHMKVLNIFCVAIMQMKLKGRVLMQYVMDKLKIDTRTSQYIRLFHNRNHGVCGVADLEARIDDALGLLLCVIYFSKQSSATQR